MDILQRLKSQQKKDKDKDSVLSAAFAKKDETPKGDPAVDPDITQIDKPKPDEKVVFREERVISRPQTFQADGLREFDLDSLKGDEHAAAKAACAQKANALILEGKLDEAIVEINDLKARVKKV